MPVYYTKRDPSKSVFTEISKEEFEALSSIYEQEKNTRKQIEGRISAIVDEYTNRWPIPELVEAGDYVAEECHYNGDALDKPVMKWRSGNAAEHNAALKLRQTAPAYLDLISEKERLDRELGQLKSFNPFEIKSLEELREQAIAAISQSIEKNYSRDSEKQKSLILKNLILELKSVRSHQELYQVLANGYTKTEKLKDVQSVIEWSAQSSLQCGFFLDMESKVFPRFIGSAPMALRDFITLPPAPSSSQVISEQMPAYYTKEDPSQAIFVKISKEEYDKLMSQYADGVHIKGKISSINQDIYYSWQIPEKIETRYEKTELFFPGGESAGFREDPVPGNQNEYDAALQMRAEDTRYQELLREKSALARALEQLPVFEPLKMKPLNELREQVLRDIGEHQAKYSKDKKSSELLSQVRSEVLAASSYHALHQVLENGFAKTGKMKEVQEAIGQFAEQEMKCTFKLDRRLLQSRVSSVFNDKTPEGAFFKSGPPAEMSSKQKLEEQPFQFRRELRQCRADLVKIAGKKSKEDQQNALLEVSNAASSLGGGCSIKQIEDALEQIKGIQEGSRTRYNRMRGSAKSETYVEIQSVIVVLQNELNYRKEQIASKRSMESKEDKEDLGVSVHESSGVLANSTMTMLSMMPLPSAPLEVELNPSQALASEHSTMAVLSQMPPSYADAMAASERPENDEAKVGIQEPKEQPEDLPPAYSEQAVLDEEEPKPKPKHF